MNVSNEQLMSYVASIEWEKFLQGLLNLATNKSIASLIEHLILVEDSLAERHLNIKLSIVG